MMNLDRFEQNNNARCSGLLLLLVVTYMWRWKRMGGERTSGTIICCVAALCSKNSNAADFFTYFYTYTLHDYRTGYSMNYDTQLVASVRRTVL